MRALRLIETGLSLPGVVCRCGGGSLAIVVPGDDTGTVPTRGWCSPDCARQDGWPWLASERPRQARRLIAPPPAAAGEPREMRLTPAKRGRP